MSSIKIFIEKRFINWNFVSSSKKRLEQAKADWIAQRFPKALGKNDFGLIPELNFLI